MSGSNAIDLLPLTDFPTEQDVSDPGFEQLFTNLVGDAATPADGFDNAVSEASSLLDSLDGALDGLSGQTGGTLDDTFSEILTVDPAAAGDDVLNLAAAIPDTEGHVDNLGNILAAAALPAPPAPGGGGGAPGPPSTDCSKRTNQYGLSNTGSFPGVTCNWTLTFQVLRVQDGPCTYSAAPAAQSGDSHLPTIDSFGLQSGDATVWGLSHHTAHASDGTPFDVVDVKITPHVAGHFDGVGVLIMNGGSRVWHVCLSVDFIA